MMALYVVLITILCNSAVADVDLRIDQVNADSLCGPRCAFYILRECGKEEDLVSLVRELRVDDVARGTSIAALQETLAKRGLFTYPIHISEMANLDLPCHAILHLESKMPAGDGHFVVQLPRSGSDDQSVAIWDGLAGIATFDRAGIAKRRTGYVLVVSTTPLGDISEYIHRRSDMLRNVLTTFAIVVVSTCVLCAFRSTAAAKERG